MVDDIRISNVKGTYTDDEFYLPYGELTRYGIFPRRARISKIWFHNDGYSLKDL